MTTNVMIVCIGCFMFGLLLGALLINSAKENDYSDYESPFDDEPPYVFCLLFGYEYNYENMRIGGVIPSKPSMRGDGCVVDIDEIIEDEGERITGGLVS